jgi:hypothetical protein
MKNGYRLGLRIWAVLAVLAAGCIAAMAAESLTWQISDPTGAMDITELHAPRLDTLAGKKICELSNDSWQAHRVLPAIRDQLRQRFPSAKFVPFTEFPQGNRGIDSEKAAELVAAKGCQAVIIGDAG